MKGTAYVSFNQVFDDLEPNGTVTYAVNLTELAFRESRKKVNRFLSLLQFFEMDLNQRIGTLSGGQRALVALAKALLSGGSLVLLDEPTNHLDLTSTQVMERALAHFPGAGVVVSHDRFFIDKIATKLLVLAQTVKYRKSTETGLYGRGQMRGNPQILTGNLPVEVRLQGQLIGFCMPAKRN